MNVSYTGMQKALAPKLQNKLDAKFAKLSKLLERKGPKEAHVVVRSERHLHKVEITMSNFMVIRWWATAPTPTCLRRCGTHWRYWKRRL